MASAEDIGDKICRCAICMEYYGEPKILPCYHRFCKRCLEGLFQGYRIHTPCPICTAKIKLPQEGVDGFPTDRDIRNLVEMIQHGENSKDDNIRKCCDCNNLLKVLAYCFKCYGFLCMTCYTSHGTNDISMGHRRHTLSMEKVESKNISMEELDSYGSAPRCQRHPYNISELCCETCNKLLICALCTRTDHKDHNCLNIEKFAKLERERLTLIMQSLENVTHSKFAITPSEVTDKLFENSEIEKEKFLEKYSKKVQIVRSEISRVQQRKEEIEKEKESIKQRAFSIFRDQRDKLIQEIQYNFEQRQAEKEKEINEQFQSRENITKRNLKKLNTELRRLKNVRDEFEKSIEKQLNVLLKNLHEIAIKFENLRRDFDEVKFKASSILGSSSNWVAVERTSDIYKKGDELFKELQRFPVLETMSRIKVDGRHLNMLKKPNITITDKELTIPVEAMRGFWTITDIAGGEDFIVIAGEHSLKRQSIIIVFDEFGSFIRQDILTARSMCHLRFCNFLSKFKVASVCQPNEIGIYDVRNGSYMKENMNEISSWPSGRNASCITTNRLNNSILVGAESSREVYIFDENLTFQYILALPEIISALTIYKTDIFICDYEGQNAYKATVDGSEIITVSELQKPEVGKTHCRPRSVCTDIDGFLYILWTSEKLFGRDRYILAQYCERDQRLIETKQLDIYARCLSVMESEKGDKLLIAAWDSPLFNVHSLVD
ncbi:E3 ubiquitin-protein ligase TRIM56 [Holothuria leucospilota]|uniref:E3 ubiquitin-protein ligase TRIM56 n=1 Tax=Holothuria leucospilota TaxID=206669 RepID=A0A9Q1H9P9_HOLLE|nr:E3 ubiquitin-protein ligase TRIM56 [Holothuria leucospilota]